MMGLWADGWFYISSAGLLVSGVLFFFLLGQYRVASEAADATESEKGADKEAAAAPAAIRPVYIPDEAPVAQVPSHMERPEPKPEPKPKAEGEFPGVERRRDPASSTGGISPAVVYLQNIKGELAELHKDLRALAQRVDSELTSVSTRDEALIERLGELTRAVEGLKAAAEAAKPEPAPRKSRKAEKAPEPEPAAEPAPVVFDLDPAIEAAEPAPAPVPEPKTETAVSSDDVIRLELGGLVAAAAPTPEPEAPAAEPEPAQAAVPTAEPEPEPAQAAAPAAEPEPEPAAALPEPPPEEKPQRGPVWPV